jgi:hypothetical protein
MGWFSWLVKPQKDKMIEWAIETLAKETANVGAAYKEIAYADVVAYVDRNGCSVLYAHGESREFEATIKGVSYVVLLNRVLDGEGAVLTAQRA